MGRINLYNVYQDRLKQIDLDIKKCIKEKRWTDMAKLHAEKARVEKLTSETQ